MKLEAFNHEYLGRLQNLTKNYASFSRNRAGLAYLVPALLLPVSFFVAKLLPLTTTGAVAGGLLTMLVIGLWLFLRWKIVGDQYQKLGVVKASIPFLNRDFFIGLLIGILIGGLLVWVFMQTKILAFPNTYFLSLPALMIAAVVGYMEFRRSGETIGMVTFLCGAFVAGGINSNADRLTEIQRIFPVVLLVILPIALTVTGFLQHQEFMRLERQLKALKLEQP